MHNKDQVSSAQPEGGEHALRSGPLLPLPAELSLEEIMDRVRVEVQRRRAEASPSADVAAEMPIDQDEFTRWTPPSADLARGGVYTLSDLLQLNDVDLLETTYRFLLRRSVDPIGRAHFLAGLRTGLMSKIEVIGAIRFSEEGRRRNVHVDGLLLPYKLHRLRRKSLAGPFAAVAIWLLRLPRFDMRAQIGETAVAGDIQRLGEMFNRNRVEIDLTRKDVDHLVKRLKSVEILSSYIEDLRTRMAETQESLKVLRTLGEHQHQAIAEKLAIQDQSIVKQLAIQYQSITGQLAGADLSIARLDVAIHESRRSVLDIQRRLMTFLERGGERSDAVSVGADHRDDIELSSILNAQYVSFEDTFRGTREDIKRRAAHYLTALDANAVKRDQGLVLDLGCGRGEWLEVLTEHGYRCRGVDLNNVMLEDSMARGFDVVEADAVSYLRGLNDDSLAAITSMHLVEHLPHEIAIRLLDEALRVLRPGGVLILETPNPENLTVGSCWFYLDPTHRNPIPPALLQWLVRERGFDDVEIERLSEYRGLPEVEFLPEDVAGSKQINQLIGLVTAPPDYAVVAVKPALNFAQNDLLKDVQDA
jgi:SAM-dependent methyltransferase